MGGVAKAIGGIFSSILGAPDVPKPPPLPKVAPMADEKASEEARRRALLASKARGGRESTILSENDKFGG